MNNQMGREITPEYGLIRGVGGFSLCAMTASCN